MGVGMDSSDEPRAGLRERKLQRTRDRVQDVALALFVEHGFDETTVDAIAEAAEVGRTSVFRYFGSKDEIVFAPEETLLEGLLEVMRTDPSRSLADVIVHYAVHVDTEGHDLHRRASIIAATPKLLDGLAHVRIKWENAVAAELERNEGAGRFESRVVAGVAMAALFIAFIEWAVTPQVPVEDLVLRAVVTGPKAFGDPGPRPTPMAERRARARAEIGQALARRPMSPR
jgi:AcrR family transcriptional regulator